LLLRNGAKVLPNSEGLYPQHLAARAGHADICQLLVHEGGADGGGKDRRDKYNQWTPLHHACVGGTASHADCLKVLIDAGCDVNAEDEYGKTPGFYAGWYGVSRLPELATRLNSRLRSLTETVLSPANRVPGESLESWCRPWSSQGDRDVVQGSKSRFREC
jgi:ankyrin repeat protein